MFVKDSNCFIRESTIWKFRMMPMIFRYFFSWTRMIRAIAIDDEPPALRVLEKYCNKVDLITLLKVFTRQTMRWNTWRKFRFDLIFLDIHMPCNFRNWFYQIRETGYNGNFFVTAHSQYAVEGFNLNAIDFYWNHFHLNVFSRQSKGKRFSGFVHSIRNVSGTVFICSGWL